MPLRFLFHLDHRVGEVLDLSRGGVRLAGGVRGRMAADTFDSLPADGRDQPGQAATGMSVHVCELGCRFAATGADADRGQRGEDGEGCAGPGAGRKPAVTVAGVPRWPCDEKIVPAIAIAKTVPKRWAMKLMPEALPISSGRRS